MHTRTLTPDEAKKIQRILAEARSGNGVLSDLAEAHDLAQEGRLQGTIAELRKYIHSTTPVSPTPQILKSVLMGMAVGLVTNIGLNSLNHYQPKLYEKLFTPPKVKRK